MRTEKKSKIQVISTFAEDRYFFKENQTRKIKKGGPAFWITETLTDLRVPFDVTTGETEAIVDIIVEKNDEDGKIVSLPLISEEPTYQADAFIISTIGDEFDLAKIANLRGIIALDVQGYVRSSTMKGEEIYQFPKMMEERIDILKTNEAELKHLDQQFIISQQNRIMLVTRGTEGFELYTSGVRTFLPSNPIVAPDTIGAGDVLLSAFVATYSKSKDAMQSALFARTYVEKFLAAK